jgi:hypothetical protein
VKGGSTKRQFCCAIEPCGTVVTSVVQKRTAAGVMMHPPISTIRSAN